MSHPSDSSPIQTPRKQAPVSPAPASGQTTPTPKRTPGKPRQLPPYRVLLHNDDINDISFVAHTVHELTPHSRATAVDITWRAHRRGVAIVVTTHQERAELYRDQFRSRGLSVTIEPAE